METNGHKEPNSEPKIRELPRGADVGWGPDKGFGRPIRLNDASMFRPEALAEHPELQDFVNAPFKVFYIAVKSGTLEAEYLLHDPASAWSGGVEGIEPIEGATEQMAGRRPITTLMVNHEQPHWIRITRTLMLDDGKSRGQIEHKEA